MPSALAFGNFDGVHLGHAEIFASACQLAKKFNLCSTAVTFNPHPSIYFTNKADFLISAPEEKKALIFDLVDNLSVLDFNTELANLSAECFLKLLCNKFDPHFIVVGPNCKFGKNAAGDADLLKKNSTKLGYKALIVEQLYKNDVICSSTNVRNFLKLGQIQQVNKILGRRYSVSGTVEKCKGIGQQIGFPTINICMPKYLAKPKLGVYKGVVKIDNNIFKGIINIGSRPTTTQNKDVFLEMHIFNFNHMIYGKKVKISFIDFIRQEKKFASLAELKTQISKDIKAC